MSLRNKKIVVLGSNGMLGQMVKKCFSSEGNEVICFDERYTPETRVDYMSFMRSLRGAVVINCVGKIKQKTDDVRDLLFVNAVLPADLRNTLHEEVILIHPSTDCVFNGAKGEAYNSSNIPDAWDDYGWSKRLGEVVLTGRGNTLIPRVSIIGPDKNPQGKGLMAWAFSQKGNTVKGFTNHYWNGITTLEWCHRVQSFLQENQNFPFSITQFGTKEHYSKYEMLQLFDSVFQLKFNIESFQTEVAVNRTLTPEVESINLKEQLLELQSFIAENGY
jgi:dTDP-4-dehydrorhamnose reductase